MENIDFDKRFFGISISKNLVVHNAEGSDIGRCGCKISQKRNMTMAGQPYRLRNNNINRKQKFFI